MQTTSYSCWNRVITYCTSKSELISQLAISKYVTIALSYNVHILFTMQFWCTLLLNTRVWDTNWSL